jgi:hypothetical protein
MYFNSFPTIPYDSNGDGKFKDVKNLMRRVAFRSKVRTNTLMFDTYDVKEGETPESIADKLYDDPELHWVVLMVNDITDRYHQWPMAQRQFLQYVNDKYVKTDGTSGADDTHHFELAQTSGDTSVKVEVYNNLALYGGDQDFYSNATPVTNYEYEERLQDERRKIRLLDPRYIDRFVKEFKSLMKETII